MEMTIVSRDVDKATARLHFEHTGVTYEDTFDLVAAVPGTGYFLSVQGRQLTEAEQDKNIDYLTTSIQKQIDAGYITNPPAPPEAPQEPAGDSQAPEAPSA